MTPPVADEDHSAIIANFCVEKFKQEERVRLWPTPWHCGYERNYERQSDHWE
jgi:hypothetical protein